MSMIELSQRTILTSLSALRDREAEMARWLTNAEELGGSQSEGLAPKVEAMLEEIRDAIADLERFLADSRELSAFLNAVEAKGRQKW